LDTLIIKFPKTKFQRIKSDYIRKKNMEWIDRLLLDWGSWKLDNHDAIPGLSYASTSISYKIMTETIRSGHKTSQKPHQKCKETRTLQPICPSYTKNYMDKIDRIIERFPMPELTALRYRYIYGADNGQCAMILHRHKDTVTRIISRAKYRLLSQINA